MRAALTTAPRRVVTTDIEIPTPEPGDLLLRVEQVGVCGTDLHIFDGSYAARLPIVQGHEISALVVELPSGYDGSLRPGDRVAVEPVTACGRCYPCRVGRRNTCQAMVAVGVHRPGGLQEQVAVPAANCHPVGDLPPDVAALVETLSVSLRAVTRPRVGSDDLALVLGAGPIGLGAVLAARDVGASVMVLDQHESRLALAAELGAERIVDDLAVLDEAVTDWTRGEGASVVVEATGAPQVAARAFDVVAHAGRISMVGVSEQPMTMSMRPFTGKEIDVYGSRATLDFPAAVALAQRYAGSLQRLVTHRFPLEDAGSALAWVHDNPQSVVKAVIEVG